MTKARQKGVQKANEIKIKARKTTNERTIRERSLCYESEKKNPISDID